MTVQQMQANLFLFRLTEFTLRECLCCRCYSIGVYWSTTQQLTHESTTLGKFRHHFISIFDLLFIHRNHINATYKWHLVSFLLFQTRNLRSNPQALECVSVANWRLTLHIVFQIFQTWFKPIKGKLSMVYIFLIA